MYYRTNRWLVAAWLGGLGACDNGQATPMLTASSSVGGSTSAGDEDDDGNQDSESKGSTSDSGDTSGGNDNSTGDGVCSDWGAGEYADCFSDHAIVTESCGGPDLCVTDWSSPSFAVCTQACQTACDCPPSPVATAEVACVDLGGEPAGECTLLCESTDQCPAGMQCIYGQYCSWPQVDECEGVTKAPYGNCLAESPICACEGFVCLGSPLEGWATCAGVAPDECTEDSDCPAGPSGTAVPRCRSLNGDGTTRVCALECDPDACPDQMSCRAIAADDPAVGAALGGESFCFWEAAGG
jgi:hypothetical protein